MHHDERTLHFVQLRFLGSSVRGMTYYAPLISMLATLALAFFLTMGKIGCIAHDIPNERSLHDKPVPRTGGIALISGVLAGWMTLQFWQWWVVLPVLGLFVLSLVDDVKNLSPGKRLVGHFFAAFVALSGAGVSTAWFVPVLLFIVWMTNLYNFMDGADGLAGGMALFGFGCYGAGALIGGHEAFALLNFSIAAAALGFLFFNFHPARIFMGDAGSIPFGFLAAVLGVWGWQIGLWPFWFPLLVFSPFVADATITLLKRAQRGEKLSHAHRCHYYQRLVQMGWGHRNTALAEYALMSLVGLSALWGIGMSHLMQGCLLLFWSVVYLLQMAWIDRGWQQYQLVEKKVSDV